MRDAARMLAEARATKFQPPAGMPTLTPVAPTATVGNVQPGTRRPNTGFKRFMVGPGGDYGDFKNPVFVGKQMANAANTQIVRPLREGADAFNPWLKQTPIERANKAAAGLLVAADLATPFIPEGTAINAVQKEAMERMLDRQAASYAESPLSSVHHRTVLGVHGSPTEGLTQIIPNPNALETARRKAPAWFWNPVGNEFDVARISDEAVRYSGPDGQVYFARFPKNESHYGWTVQTGGVNPPTAWYSEAPGDVINSMEGFWSKARSKPGYGVFDHNNPGTFKDESYAHDFVATLENSMTPSERRAFREKQPNLANILAQRKARVQPTVAPRERFTEEELYALRPRPTLQQLQNAIKIPLEEM